MNKTTELVLGKHISPGEKSRQNTNDWADQIPKISDLAAHRMAKEFEEPITAGEIFGIRDERALAGMRRFFTLKRNGVQRLGLNPTPRYTLKRVPKNKITHHVRKAIGGRGIIQWRKKR